MCDDATRGATSIAYQPYAQCVQRADNPTVEQVHYQIEGT